jgi:hypothetical protein
MGEKLETQVEKSNENDDKPAFRPLDYRNKLILAPMVRVGKFKMKF